MDEIPSPQWKAESEILTLYDIIGLESINNVNTYTHFKKCLYVTSVIVNSTRLGIMSSTYVRAAQVRLDETDTVFLAFDSKSIQV